MAVDLLDGFTFGPTAVSDEVTNEYFAQHFWWSSTKYGSSQESQGDKNQGFDVLYHNMKHGQISVTSLKDFIRESANWQDLYAKNLTKLAKQATNSSPLGSFAPVFDVFKVMAEKLSSCHMDVVHKLHEIIKDLSKYFDEQKGKHKQVKDELSGTADALHQIQSTTAAVQKSKEKYHQLCMEAERLRRAGALSKEIEKAEAKCKKASEDYKHLVEKYENVRSDYQQKMTDSAKRFQEVEVAHLKHMKSVLDSYILSYENANVLVSQVYQEFRRQVDEHTIDSLIKKYSESKGTGTEKPAPIVFEECDVNSMLVSVESPHTNGMPSDEGATHTQVPNKVGRRPIALPFRRKKPRNKQAKENNTVGNKEQDKEADLTDSPDKDSSVKIDEEGYTIRPETPKESKSSWGFDSSDDSDSDSDDFTRRKIHVKINPKDEASAVAGDNNLVALNAITRVLTLNSPTPVGGKKLTPPNENSKQPSQPTSQKTEKSVSEDILDLFGNTSTSLTPKSAAPTAPGSNSDVLTDFFGSKAAFPASTTSSTSKLQSSSNSSPTNLFLAPVDKDGDKEVVESKNLRTGESPSHTYVNSIDLTASSISSAPRPNNLTLTTNAWAEPMKATTPAPLASSESWSSLSSLGGTPMDSFASSRGPSPLTLSHGDPIPIAVAFTETINAYFKGPQGDRCMAKITGEVQISFPAGIVRAFTSNPNPAVLSFRLKGNSKLQNIVPNKSFLCTDPSLPDASEHSFWFDMTSLTSNIKKMTDSNPNSPYYNIQVLSYQLSSQTGHSIVPLHLTSQWKCDVDSTDVTVDYKYNSTATSSPLKNVQILVPVDGGVTTAQSTPSAAWIQAQNRLVWKLVSPISSSAPVATLKSKLALTAGPSKSKSLAVQFVSEGSTLTGSDFELTGAGYRLSLVKKRFTSGKYLLDAS